MIGGLVFNCVFWCIVNLGQRGAYYPCLHSHKTFKLIASRFGTDLKEKNLVIVKALET